MSVASYPPRFPGLADALESLLFQSIRPDRIILWIEKEDLAKLPYNVRRLRWLGVQIGTVCRPLRAYKKLLPSLRKFPRSFIVTADDDMIYPRDWLAGLTGAWRAHNEIIFHRGHLMRIGEGNIPVTYKDWELETKFLDASPFVFPTGVCGVLYPPGAMHPEVFNETAFTQLCPTNDDIWFYWMGRKNGRVSRWSGVRVEQNFLEGSQDVGLYQTNVDQFQNDVQIASMIKRYGAAWDMPISGVV